MLLFILLCSFCLLPAQAQELGICGQTSFVNKYAFPYSPNEVWVEMFLAPGRNVSNTILEYTENSLSLKKAKTGSDLTCNAVMNGLIYSGQLCYTQFTIENLLGYTTDTVKIYNETIDSLACDQIHNLVSTLSQFVPSNKTIWGASGVGGCEATDFSFSVFNDTDDVVFGEPNEGQTITCGLQQVTTVAAPSTSAPTTTPPTTLPPTTTAPTTASPTTASPTTTTTTTTAAPKTNGGGRSGWEKALIAMAAFGCFFFFVGAVAFFRWIAPLHFRINRSRTWRSVHIGDPDVRPPPYSEKVKGTSKKKGTVLMTAKYKKLKDDM